MTKRIAIILSAFLLISMLGGCVYVGFGSGGNGRLLTGKGAITTREVDIDSIRDISIGNNAELRLVRGDKPHASIEAYENYFDVMTIRTSQSKLDIFSDYGFRDKITVTVVAPELSRIYIAGSVTFVCDEALTLGDLTLDVAGYCDGTLHVEAANMDIMSAGASSITLKGSAENFSASVTGSGKVSGDEFTARQASVNITGAGEISLRCEEQLNVSVSGAGTVNYYGNPRVSQSIAGVGTIRKMSE